MIIPTLLSMPQDKTPILIPDSEAPALAENTPIAAAAIAAMASLRMNSPLVANLVNPSVECVGNATRH
jgi:hypothetical protein